MRQFIYSLLFLFFFSAADAQGIRISGHLPSASAGSLTLNLLAGDGYYDTYQLKTTSNKAGDFEFQASPGRIMLAELKLPGRRVKLLLVPGRDLDITIPEDGVHPIQFKGDGAKENELLGWSVMGKSPFFASADYNANPYVKVTRGQWFDRIQLPVETELKELDYRLATAGLPDSISRYLRSETRYAFQCFLNDFANNDLRWGNNPDRNGLLDMVMNWQPIPDSSQLIDGFYASMFVHRVASWQVNRLAEKMKGNRRGIQDAIADYLGRSFAEIDSLVRLYGERYMLSWMYSEKYLPRSIRDRVVYNKLMDAMDAGDLATGFWLMDRMREQYPSGQYFRAAEKIAGNVRERLDVQSAAGIVFRTPGSVSTLDELLKPYRGKIVLLDIWGTWCGPCRIQMEYMPALKQQFNCKDMVFLYLDMDEQAKDSKWKDYVKYFGIQGEHYRMDDKGIEAIWKEVKAAGGETNRYPTFVLVDRNGKIRIANAEAPSSGEKLSAQIQSMF